MEPGTEQRSSPEQPPAREQPPPAEPPGRRLTPARIALILGLLAVGAVAWWLHARDFEDTDDAQIDGNIGSISPRVAGTVIAVHVADNQPVRAGEILVQLDPTDLEVAVLQARAAVAQAEAQLAAEHPSVSITQTSNRAAVESAAAEVQSARADLEAAQRELDQAEANDKLAQLQLERARQLVAGSAMAPADYDQRVATAEVTRAAVAAARQRRDARRARLDTALTRQRETEQNAPRQLVAREATVQVRQANLELARAQLRQAELNLGYARVVAPADGIIGRKSVNVGDRVQPGQQLCALTQTGDLWVTANFRETQVRLMKPGQPADVHVDALDRSFHGRVESFAGATGSRYSLLPPENATGNYVKVVQRLPVRIRLDPGQPGLERLRPGMSVVPDVRIR
jgi:membrane fusion protein (multidrug efflux system)